MERQTLCYTTNWTQQFIQNPTLIQSSKPSHSLFSLFISAPTNQVLHEKQSKMEAKSKEVESRLLNETHVLSPRERERERESEQTTRPLPLPLISNSGLKTDNMQHLLRNSHSLFFLCLAFSHRAPIIHLNLI